MTIFENKLKTKFNINSFLNQDRIHEFPSPMLNIIIHIDFLQVPYLYSCIL